MSDFTVDTAVTAKDEASRPVERFADKLQGRLVGAANRARAALSRLAGASRDAVVGAAKYASVGAVAVGGLALKVANDFTDAADEAAEFAARVALPIEALQEYRYAAERSGAGADAFNAGIEKFNVQLGKLKAGTGGLAKFLGRVAPALKEQLALAKDSDEAFMLMAEAVRRLDDPTQQAALATAAWGSAGNKLLLMMKGGAGDIDELRRAAHRFGVITEADAAKAGELDDAMVDLKASTTGLRNVIGVALVPVLTPMVQRLTEWITANRDLVGSKVAEWVERLSNAASAAYDYLAGVDWPRIGDGIQTVAGWAWDFGSAVAWCIDKVGGLEVALGLLVGAKLVSGLAGVARTVGAIGAGAAAVGGGGAAAGAAGASGAAATGSAGVGLMGKAGRALGVVGAVAGLGAWVYGMATETQAENRAQREQALEASRRRGLDARDFGALSGTNAPTLPVPEITVVAPAAPSRPSTMDLIARIAASRTPGPVFDPTALSRTQAEKLRLEIDIKGAPKGTTATVVESTPAIDPSLRVGRRN